eukprot:scaffold1160_cov261-Pinguiococcus_pyrenoidosus.AAC.5
MCARNKKTKCQPLRKESGEAYSYATSLRGFSADENDTKSTNSVLAYLPLLPNAEQGSDQQSRDQRPMGRDGRTGDGQGYPKETLGGLEARSPIGLRRSRLRRDAEGHQTRERDHAGCATRDLASGAGGRHGASGCAVLGWCGQHCPGVGLGARGGPHRQLRRLQGSARRLQGRHFVHFPRRSQRLHHVSENTGEAS